MKSITLPHLQAPQHYQSVNMAIVFCLHFEILVRLFLSTTCRPCLYIIIVYMLNIVSSLRSHTLEIGSRAMNGITGRVMYRR
jgi:uncharacterized membrane protein